MNKTAFRSATFRISSIANFTAGYNLAITGYVLALLGLSGSNATEAETSATASAALAGAIIGQFSFGSLSNYTGLEFGLAIALALCVFGNLLSAALAFDELLFPFLIIGRFLVGIGAGGVYPLSAVASAEATDEETRGRRMMVVFSFQGIGQILAPLSILLYTYLLNISPMLSWRLSLVLGAIIPLSAIPIALKLSKYRSTEEETSCRRQNSSQKKCTGTNIRLLIGTAGSWFLFDFIFYGNVIFTPFMLEKVFSDIDFAANPLKLAEYSTVIYILALPGIYLASWYSDFLGRKNIQMFGFFCCGSCFLCLSIFEREISEKFSFIIYIFSFFFYNFGPNATTFCLPAETFSKDHRTFFNGLSAAAGKVGAVLGAASFKYLLDQEGLAVTFLICATTSYIGVLLTFMFVLDQRGKILISQFEDKDDIISNPGEHLLDDFNKS